MAQRIKPVALQLKVGDRIRIVDIPGVGIPDYYLHSDTKRVYTQLIARRRSVRIYMIDEHGQPWYKCRFRTKNGQWEYHHLAVFDTDNNWVLVNARPKK